MLEQSFFVEGRYLGSCPRPPINTSDLMLRQPLSLAWFCPVCAEVWARAVIPGRNFFCYHVACSKHQYDGGGIPGSLWVGLSMEPDMLQAIEGDVLKRELELHLTYAERQLELIE